ncbi:MAG: hypothetical protein Q9204_007127, partial [Flavoplaca sp. TL-2023a]
MDVHRIKGDIRDWNVCGSDISTERTWIQFRTSRVVRTDICRCIPDLTLNHTPSDDFQSSITDIVRAGVTNGVSNRRLEKRRGEYGEDLA